MAGKQTAPWQRLGRLHAQLLPPQIAPARCAAAADAPELPPGARDLADLRTWKELGAIPERPLEREEEEARMWKEYAAEGVKRAMALGNRGPVRLDAQGKLAKEIVDAYWRTGFYVFENVMRPEEVADLQAEFDGILENAPAARGSKVDKLGRPVRFAGDYNLAPPYGSAPGAPLTVALLGRPLRNMDSAVRLYGHPHVLKIAEAMNGEDFTPFGEVIFHKGAGIGPATQWHQDGRTHWNEDGSVDPENLGCHGFSFHGAFSECTAEQCLWVLPGSHRQNMFSKENRQGIPGAATGDGKYDSKRVAGSGSPQQGGIFRPGEMSYLPDAVPMLMKPGDVGMHNRNCLHGSFPNKSPASPKRVTMVFGFHNRRFVLGTRARDPVPRPYVEELRAKHDVDADRRVLMDEAYVHESTRMIQVAIDARRQKYPDETPYVYKPLVGEEDMNRWNAETRENIINTEGKYACTI